MTRRPAPDTPRGLLGGVLRRRRRALALATIASIVHQSCEALVPLAIGLSVGGVVAGRSTEGILVAIGLIVALFALLAAGGAITYWVVTAISYREAHELRVAGAQRVLAGEVVDRRAGDLLSALTSDATETARVLRVPVSGLSGVAGLLVTALVLVDIDVALGLSMLAAAGLLLLATHRVGRALEGAAHDRQTAAGDVAALAAEYVHALRALLALGVATVAAGRFTAASRQARDHALHAADASAGVVTAGWLANGVLLVGTTAWAAALAVHGTIGLGEFVTAVAMTSFVASPIARIAAAVAQLGSSRASARRLATLATLATTSATETREPEDPPVLVVPGVTAGLRLVVGEVVGVAAADPAATGPLLAALRTAGATVHVEPHHVALLGDSRDEVLETGRGPDPARAARALAVAHAAGLPDHLLDGAANLSGGERQRLALARALAHDAPVLVLQDPLSAVDAVTEQAIAAALVRARRGAGATVLVTTSSGLLAHCDRIIWLPQRGRALVGSPDELSADADYRATVLT